jgi:methyl-accepting chemotaxis protein
MTIPATSTPAPAPRAFKRRTLIIKRGLQVKFILLVMSSVMLAIGLIWLELYRTFGLEIVRDLMDPSLNDVFQGLVFKLLIWMVIYVALLGAVTVYLSNKLGGPIYRFERSTRVLAQGDLTHRVFLRKGDELGSLQDEFNTMADALQRRVVKDRNLAQRISKNMTDLMQAKYLAPEAQKRLEEMKSEIDHMTTDFKV